MWFIMYQKEIDVIVSTMPGHGKQTYYYVTVVTFAKVILLDHVSWLTISAVLVK